MAVSASKQIARFGQQVRGGFVFRTIIFLNDVVASPAIVSAVSHSAGKMLWKMHSENCNQEYLQVVSGKCSTH